MTFPKYLILPLLFVLVAFRANAQNCDKYYKEGLSKQATQTVESLNAAIALFNKAMACYDSSAKKQLCQAQITKCHKMITNLERRKNLKQQGSVPPKKTSRDKRAQNDIQPPSVAEMPSDSLQKIPEAEAQQAKAYLDVKPTLVEFKKKGGVEIVRVRCGLGFTWSVEDVPNWLEITTNEDVARIACSQNKTGADRTAKLRIISTGNCREITVTQYHIRK